MLVCKARKNYQRVAYRQIRRTMRFEAQLEQMSVFQQPVRASRCIIANGRFIEERVK